MAHFVKHENIGNDSCVSIFTGSTKADIDNLVDKLFKSSGYKTIEGEPGSATYEKGNRTMRILFGAFAKHFIYKVKSYSQESDSVKVTIVKGTSGIAGGLVGLKQVKDETNRISRELEKF